MVFLNNLLLYSVVSSIFSPLVSTNKIFMFKNNNPKKVRANFADGKCHDPFENTTMLNFELTWK